MIILWYPNFFYFSRLKKTGELRAIRSGEVAEWSKAHAWKVCVRHKRTEGSNPSLSATFLCKLFKESIN